jgi:hypothetical protein
MSNATTRHEKLREKLAPRCQPFLPPGREVRHVFLTQTGPNPFWMILTLWMLAATKYWIVCVTDDGIHVLRGSVGAKPRELAGTLPRGHQLGPVSGVWAQIQLLGDRHWVHKRFHDVVRAADAERGAPA